MTISLGHECKEAYMTKLKALLAGLGVAVFAFVGFSLLFSGNTNAVGSTPDCTTGAVIKCGVTSGSDLAGKVSTNMPGDLPAIYTHYGIPTSQLTSNTGKAGVVTKDGQVIYNGTVVATAAGTVGRLGYSGDNKVVISGKTFYEHSTQKSFVPSQLNAIIFFDANGQFIGAVLYSCGNPIYATPVPKPPVPVYTCDLLTVASLTRTSVRATVASTAKNGATVTGYGFDWGDGSTVTQSGPVLDHNYAKEGAYTIRASVLVTVDGQNKVVVSDACVKQISIQPEMCTVPGKENYPVGSPECTKTPYCRISDRATVSLYPSEVTSDYTTDFSKCAAPPVVPEFPHTGIGEMLGGSLGLGALTTAALYYVASRRAIGRL